MADFETPEKPVLPTRERLKLLCDTLSDDALAEEDEAYPEAEQIKYSLLRRLAKDPRTQSLRAEILSVLEQEFPEMEGRLAGRDKEPQSAPKIDKLRDGQTPPERRRSN